MTPADLVFFTIALLAATGIGFLLVDLLSPADFPRWLIGAFAPMTGLGICSLVVFFFRRPMFTVEGLLLAVLLISWFRSHRTLQGWREVISWRVPILGVAFALAVGWAVASSAARVERNPHGGTDGWAIWDSHARYMASGDPTWKHDLEYTFHPDYPLLLPGVVVHAWRYIGHDVPDAAGLVGIAYLLAGIAVLAATLGALRSSTTGLIMAFALIGSPYYVLHATSQYADIPLSMYFLGTIALICLYEEDASKPVGLIALAGFMAGCAAWTKNEGSPFILVTFAVLLAPVLWKPSATLRRVLGFAAGLALPLAALVYFKLAIAPPNDLLADRNTTELLAKIMSPDRYIMIARNFLTMGWVFGGWLFNPFIPILAFVGFSGVHRFKTQSFGWTAGIAIVLMVLAGYIAIYVITPIDLQEHMKGSLDRLLMQVWPACLLLAGMAVRKKIPASA